MAQAGIDALAMPPAGGHWDHWLANQRYLSQVGGHQYRVAMVFPAEGEPTIIIPVLDEARFWRQLAWVDDIRAGNRFGKGIADRIKELGLQSGTIGVPGLNGAVRSAESPVPSGAMDALRVELPGARFVDATALMADQRAVKSDEEIAMLERAAAAAEWGIFTLGYHVHAGMPQPEALGILQGAILKAGGELSNQIMWDCSPKPGRTGWFAAPQPIRRGDVIQNDMEAKVAGYSAREVHPICVGKPIQAVYEMFALSARIFEEALPLLKPGTSIAELRAMVEGAGEGTPFTTSLASMGTGLALEELPETLHDRLALFIKPIVRDDDGLAVNFCGTVLVTPEGGRRLSKRPLELMLTSRSFMAPYLEQPRDQPKPPWLT